MRAERCDGSPEIRGGVRQVNVRDYDRRMVEGGEFASDWLSTFNAAAVRHNRRGNMVARGEGRAAGAPAGPRSSGSQAASSSAPERLDREHAAPSATRGGSPAGSDAAGCRRRRSVAPLLWGGDILNFIGAGRGCEPVGLVWWRARRAVSTVTAGLRVPGRHRPRSRAACRPEVGPRQPRDPVTA